MIVWVVMSNDFPDSVYANQRLAEAYISEKNQEQQRDSSTTRMIYWRAYEFKVR